MTLHEAVEIVLKENNRPMSSKAIADRINTLQLYNRYDQAPITPNQIVARVRRYPILFQYINGQISLAANKNWKDLLTTYWSIAGTLRGIFSVENYQFIVIFLLFLKRLMDKGILPEISNPLNLLHKFTPEVRENFAVPLSNSYARIHENLFPMGIIDDFLVLFSKLDSFKAEVILTDLFDVDTRGLDDKEFGNIFEYLITIDFDDNDKSLTQSTPYSLRELMISILNPEPSGSIYDPVTGIGGLLINAYFHENGKPLIGRGIEINHRIAQYGNMNLVMHGIQDFKIEYKDCFTEIYTNDQYDYIVADLPLPGVQNSFEILSLYTEFQLPTSYSKTSLTPYVLFILHKLKEGGKAVVAISDSFLASKGTDMNTRQLLVERDLVEAVISLPYGTLRPYTDAKISLIILNKKKSNLDKNRIHFITGEASNKDTQSLILNNDEILANYRKFSNLTDHLQIVEVSDLKADFSLSPDAYDRQSMLLNEMHKEGSGRLLSELATIKTGIQPEKADFEINGDIHFINAVNLSNNILNPTLPPISPRMVYYSPSYERFLIKENAILLARTGYQFRTSIFYPTLEIPSIIIGNDIFAIIPKESVINIEYLYYQLYSPLVSEQIQKRKDNGVVPTLSPRNLRNILIPYVGFNAQFDFVKFQKAVIISEVKKRNEGIIDSKESKDTVEQAESDTVRTLVHQLRPTLTNLNLDVEILRRIIKDNNIGELAENLQEILLTEDDLGLMDDINPPSPTTLDEIAEKLASETLRLSEVLTTVNKVMSFKVYPEDFTPIPIKTFFVEYINTKVQKFESEFKIEVIGDNVEVEINEASFRELIDELLRNASHHAFKDSKVPVDKRLVQFNFKSNIEKQVLLFDYYNNGARFTLDQENYVRAFQKSQSSNGSGIGGNFIQRIIQAHNGILNIKHGHRAGFEITFEIPLRQTNNYEQYPTT